MTNRSTPPQGMTRRDYRASLARRATRAARHALARAAYARAVRAGAGY